MHNMDTKRPRVIVTLIIIYNYLNSAMMAESASNFAIPLLSHTETCHTHSKPLTPHVYSKFVCSQIRSIVRWPK